MAFKLNINTAWIETDGAFGVGSVITFHENDLTPGQWSILCDLPEDERLSYVYAIMAGEPLTEWEARYA